MTGPTPPFHSSPARSLQGGAGGGAGGGGSIGGVGPGGGNGLDVQAHGPVPLVLVGGGGHALVVLEAAWLSELPVAGYIDDNPAAPVSAILINVPHPYPAPPNLGGLNDAGPLTGRHWVLAVGDLALRRRLLGGVVAGLGRRRDAAPGPRSVIHPTAFVSPSALVEAGTYVGPRAVVHARARVGEHGIINSGAIVEHDCTLDENVHVAPGAVLGGGVHVGSDTLVGLGARVLPGVRLGARAIIGAGSVVLGDVPDGVTAVGVVGGR